MDERGCCRCDRSADMGGACATTHACGHFFCGPCNLATCGWCPIDLCSICSPTTSTYPVRLSIRIYNGSGRTGWAALSTTTIAQIKDRLRQSVNHPPDRFDLVDEDGTYWTDERQTVGHYTPACSVLLEYRSNRVAPGSK